VSARLSLADVTRQYADVRVLVLGATGFIGGAVARALLEAEAHLSLVARDDARAETLRPWRRFGADVVAADLRQPADMSRLLADVRPQVVFNLAGYGVDRTERDPATMAALNTRLVETLCERLAGAGDDRWRGARLVHAGSALEYGRAAGRLREEMPPEPSTEYGRTKLAGTDAVRSAGAAGLPCVVARLFNVYGPGEHPDRLLASLLRAAFTGGRVALSTGTQRRDFTFVGDVSEGLLRLGLVPAPRGNLVNLATGRLTSVRDFATVAAAAVGLDPGALDFGAIPVNPDEMYHDEVDIARMREETSWVPCTSIAEGVRQTFEAEHAQRRRPA
jgi:nucleoside-diphosphate-sugar epimerase